MSDKDPSGAITALKIAYHELVVALGRSESLNTSSLAATLDQLARAERTDEQARAYLASIAKRILNP